MARSEAAQPLYDNILPLSDRVMPTDREDPSLCDIATLLIYDAMPTHREDPSPCDNVMPLIYGVMPTDREDPSPCGIDMLFIYT